MHLKVSAGLLCLLCAVLFCGAQTSTPSPNTTTTTNSTQSTSSTPPPSTSTATMTTQVNNVTEITPTPKSGLSDGAIAGIVIGSIAGAGLLGGGVYGALKYTGKI
ncbi:hypothetical protein NQD34_010316 [Periophthalmus magnuspinnatus]|nr:hypothetical protein NQD34_010316 [Periophthalmus magnuspinnatus]